MAYSYFQYTGNGTTQIFSTPLYLDQGHIHVYVNGVEITAFTWVTSSTISITTAPASGAVVIVKRITPLDSQLVDFTSGSLLNEETMDLMATFNLYVAQEVEDKTELVLAVDENNLIDSHNKRIINLADAVDDTDAMNKQSVEALTASSVAQAEAARDTAVSARDATILNATAASEDAAAAENAKEDAETAAASVVGMEADLDALQTDGKLDVVTSGGFWTDDATPGKLHRLADRLVVGKVSSFTGSWAGSTSDATMGALFRWGPREATGIIASPNGRIGLCGTSQASDQTDVNPADGAGTCAIGVAGFGVANGSLSNANAWGGYFEAIRASGSSNAAFGIEVDVGSDQTGTYNATPYSLWGAGAYGINIGAGGSHKSGYADDPTAAIVICQNPYPDTKSSFKKGIIFEDSSIDGADGVTGTGTAICMAKGHIIEWQASDGISSQIMSTISSTASKHSMLFDNSGVYFNGPSSNVIFAAVNVANSVNYLRTYPAATGGVPGLQATGTDTNVDLALVTKGTGTLRFGTWASGSGTVNGYVTIKDSGGTTRKLATIA